MKKKYILPTPEEKSLAKIKKKEEINKALIALRRSYLNNVKPNKKLDFKVSHFKKVIKSKEEQSNVDMISLLLFLDKLE